MKPKVIVTGGAGFIGSRLVEKLIQKDLEVHVLDNLALSEASRLKKIKGHKNLFYTQGDLRDKKLLEEWYPEEATHLFHLASVVGVQHYIKNPLALIDIVVVGTRNLLELAVKNKTRVLFTSTSEVYGKNPNLPWSESDNRVLGSTSIDRWSYSSSKAVCEHMLYALKKSDNLKFSIIRFFNVYGPGQSPIFVISKTIHQILNDKAPIIYDSGKQTRCFTYIDDVIDGILKASSYENAISEIINLGSSTENSIYDVINLINKYAKKKLTPINIETKDKYGSSYEDIIRRVPDVSKAKSLLDWEAKTALKDGIKLSIDWSLKNKWWLD